MIVLKNRIPGTLYKTTFFEIVLWDKQSNMICVDKNTILMYLLTETEKERSGKNVVKTHFIFGNRILYSEVYPKDINWCLWDSLVKIKE